MPADENRLRIFASFFKGYMGVMPVVTAAVAPLLTMMKAIPVYDSQKAELATYSGLLGFLLLAWVFYARSGFAFVMIPSRLQPGGYDGNVGRVIARGAATMLPLILILFSIASYVQYNEKLDESVNKMSQSTACAHKARSEVLQKCGDTIIWGAAGIRMYYLGIFLFAEFAFVVMALREYAYGRLDLSEVQILNGIKAAVGQSEK